MSCTELAGENTRLSGSVWPGAHGRMASDCQTWLSVEPASAVQHEDVVWHRAQNYPLMDSSSLQEDARAGRENVYNERKFS